MAEFYRIRLKTKTLSVFSKNPFIVEIMVTAGKCISGKRLKYQKKQIWNMEVSHWPCMEDTYLMW